MKDVFFSFVIPVYNAHLYIEQCIRSLLNQDISLEEYEIICVDDGSNDDSVEIINKLRKEFTNLVVYCQKNSGVSSARNQGLNLAKGKYVWFVDADDFIAPNILKQLKEIVQSSKADRITVESYSFVKKLSFNEQEKMTEKKLLPNVPYKKVMVTRTLYKREYLISKSILFLTGVHYGEDGLFNYQTLIYNPLTIESGILAYFYRMHNESATGSKDKTLKSRKSLSGSKLVMNVLVDDYNKKICVYETRRMLLYWMYGILENYSFLGKNFFLDNFNWEYHLQNIPITDLELLKLNRVMTGLSKTHDYQKLMSVIKRQNRKQEFRKKTEKQKKAVLGYIKHPRRLINKVLNIN